MTEAEIRDLLGYEDEIPSVVARALAQVPAPESGDEVAKVILQALRAAGQLGHSLVPRAPDMRRRYR